MTTQNNKKLIPAVIISLLTISLIGSWAYFLAQEGETQEVIQESEQEIASHEDLKLELRILEDEFKSLQKDSDGKDVLINAKDSLIINKQNEIKKLLSKNKLSQNEVDKAKSLIASLKGEIVSYKEQIVLLQNENSTLKVQKDHLLVQNQGTIIQRDSVKRKLKIAKEEIVEKDSLLNTASTLKASNFAIEGIKVRNSGKEVETVRSRRVNKLRVSFDIDKNEVTPFGPKDLYICLYKPNGHLAKFNESENGSITSRTGEEIYYSDQLAFNYNSRDKIPVAFDWEQENFEKGDYRIVLYQNGYKVGESVKTLK
ncbi:hypothetical protein UJ101_01279 [Flavobacteriaceae bacterium UJ101]|nr:hypothetical protein UJ101_01279 [Flavobacteriaceae bacterium UJ101]